MIRNNSQIVLGGGASGLSFGVLDESAVIYEETDKIGGHSQSQTVDGWTFDRGPHIMFSRDKVVLKAMIASLGENIHTCRRKNRVSLAGELLNYPIENDLGKLPQELLVDIVSDYLETQINPTSKSPNNLDEWFQSNFGKKLTDVYFRPYNEKIWNIPLAKLSMQWADRIPSPPWKDVLQGALGSTTEGYLHQLFYQYPLKGGYGALMKAWAAKLSPGQVVTNSKLTKVLLNENQLPQIQINGEPIAVSKPVISTVPLHYLAEICEGIDRNILELIAKLPVNPQIVCNLGFDFPDENQFTAVYIPDEDFQVNRVSYPGVFSPNNLPDQNSTLIQAEITCAANSPILEWSDEEVISHVLEGLKQRNLVPESAVPRLKIVERFDRAYVVYTNSYEKDIATIKQYFLDRGVILHGRFGAHEYLNVDGCLRASIDLFQKINEVELTESQLLQAFTAS